MSRSPGRDKRLLPPGLLKCHAQQFRPVPLPRLVCKVILPDLDFGIIQRTAESVAGNAVVCPVHVIGLVVTDAQAWLARECTQQPARKALVSARVKDTDIPRPLELAEDRRKAVQRDQHDPPSGAPAPCDFVGQSGVVGLVNFADTQRSLARGKALVARHRRPVAGFRNGFMRRGIAIAVHDKAGIGLRQKYGIKTPGKGAAQFGNADVERDMTGQGVISKAERPEPGRYCGAGMVSGQDERRRTERIEALNGSGIARAKQALKAWYGHHDMVQTCRT